MSKRLSPPNTEQRDLFFVDVADVAFKDAQHVMTAPFLSLSKRPRFKAINFKTDKGDFVTVTGGEPFGIATIWDFDIMLWLFGQIRSMIDKGEEPTRYIGFHPYECLTGSKRHTGKHQYEQLEAAITRLKNTSIYTNIGNTNPKGSGAGWLDNFVFHRHPSGRLNYVEVWINQWIFDKVIDQALILTIHPNYFLLTGGIERFLYRTARKMAGRQKNGWAISMDELFVRSAVEDREHFVSQVRRVASLNDDHEDALPEYRVIIARKGEGRKFTEMVTFQPREYSQPKANKKPIERGATDHRSYGGLLAMSDDAYDEAKIYCRTHDLDFHTFHEQWRNKHVKSLIDNGSHGIREPGRAFLGYLQGVVKKRFR
jgi:plasmid replication initiation protein